MPAPPSADVPCAPRTDPTPLSPQQRALWIEQKLRDDDAYNEPLAVLVDVALEPDRLRKALERLAERHEVLRARVMEGEGTPCIVFDRATDDVHLEVLSGGRPRDAVRAAIARPFDRRHGPLWRALLHLNEGVGSLLLLVIDHLICDAPSQDILLRDLARAYERPGEPLPQADHHPAEMCAREREKLARDRERLDHFWTQHLADAKSLTPPLPPPVTPCPAGEESRALTASVDLDPDVSRGVREVARQCETSPFVVYLTACLALLRLHAGTNDVCVGTPVSLRDDAASSGVVNYLVSPVAFRHVLRGDASIAETIRVVDASWRQVQDHARLPLDLVLRTAFAGRRQGTAEPPGVFFGHRSVPDERPTFDGADARWLRSGPQHAKLPLYIEVEECGNAASLHLECRRDVLDGESAQRFVAQLATVVRHLISDVDEPLDTVEALDAAESQRARLAALPSSNLHASHVPGRPASVTNAIAAIARTTPDKIAVVEPSGEAVSFGDLVAAADALAARLRERGIGTNDLVPVVQRRGWPLIATWLGILRAGAAYAAIDPGHPPARRAAMLEDCGPTVIVAEPDLVATPPGDAEVWAPPSRSSHATQIAEDRDAGEDDLAYVMFTSGSTGRPKGVEIPRRGLRHIVAWVQRRFQLDASHRVSLVSGLGFDGSVWETWPTLAAGAALHMPDEDVRVDAERLQRWMLDRRLTLAYAPTPIGEALLRLEWPDGTSLRTLQIGGERLRRRPRERTPFEVVNLYGPTECTVWATTTTVTPDGDGLPDIGRPLDDCSAYVVDLRGHPCGAGMVGELWLGGPQLARGYRGLPERTATAFPTVQIADGPPERVYRTGDLVRRRDDGALEFVGRRDGQIKLRGVRIEIGEVEAALQDLPGVGTCAVVLRTIGESPHLVAFVEPSDTAHPPSPESLREQLSLTLVRTMVPTRWQVLTRLPRTPSGKLDRLALPDVEAPRESESGNAPQGAVESTIAELFGRVLGVTVGSRDADLLRLGGHSFDVVRLAILVREAFDVDVPLGEVFTGATVQNVAAIVRRLRAEGRTARRLVRVSRDEPTPLSPQQRALWIELKLRADADAYNEPLAVEVDCALDPERMRAALIRVAERHEALRARVVPDQGAPRLAYDRDPRHIEFEVVRHDASRRSGRSVDPDDALDHALRLPFDRGQGPLWRAQLQIVGPERSMLLLVVDHLICDGPALEMLLRDLARTYANPGSPLPAAPFDLADVCAHERVALARDRADLEAFWAARLADSETLTPRLPPPLQPCAEGDSRRAATFRHRLPPGTHALVRERAQADGITTFIVYLTAYLALLRLYSGNDDVCVGTPVSLRDHAGAESVLGYLVSPVAFRHVIDGSASVRTTLEAVDRAWRDTQTHARLPLDLVLRAAFAGRHHELIAPPGLFFGHRQTTERAPTFDEHVARTRVLDPHHAKFPLYLEVQEDGERATLTLECRRDVFDAGLATAFLRQLATLVDALARDPESTIDTLPVLPPRDRERVAAWENGPNPAHSAATILDLFDEVCASRGAAVAVQCGGETLTYDALRSAASGAADALQSLEVGAGSHVILALPRSIDGIIWTLGTLRAGAAYVPVDPDLPAGRLEQLAALVGARVAVTSRGTSQLPEVHHLLPDAWRAPATGTAREPIGVAPDAPAYVMFTSGSTGNPKAVQVPHRAVVRLVRGQFFAEMGPDETWLHMASSSFDASTLEIWAPLLNGGRCVVFADSLPTASALASVIAEGGVTSAWITASLFNALVDEAPECLRGLRQILTGGETLSPRHVRRALELLPGVRLVNGYGPTENTTFTCCHVIEAQDVAPGGTVPIGRPIAGTDVRIVTAGGASTPVGMPGELIAAGAGVALGYVGDAAETTARFERDADDATAGLRYRTGDRVRWRGDGTIEFLGRFDDQVKIRGFRIEPGEVASCLARHPGVRRAAVLVEGRGSDSARLVAFVVPENGDIAEDLRAALLELAAEELPSYMRPSRIEVRSDLPLSATGKLDRRALTAAAPRSTHVDTSQPSNHQEARILAIWRRLLESPEAGMGSDFFELGGHSVLAVRIVAELETELGRRFDFAAFFQDPTPRGIAAQVLRRPPEVDRPEVVSLRVGAQSGTLYCIPGLGGHVFSFRRFAELLEPDISVVGLQLQELDRREGALDSMDSIVETLLDSVRATRGDGPTLLVGYSFGGNVALEIAARLRSEGDEPGFVGLLDAYAPSSVRPATPARKLVLHARELLRRGPREMLEYVGVRIARRLGLRRRRPAAAEAPVSGTEARISAVSERCRAAYDSYAPAPYAGNVDLLRATRLNDWVRNDEAMQRCGWGDLLSGDVEILDIDCEHMSLLHEPHLSRLVEALGSRIETRLESGRFSQTDP